MGIPEPFKIGTFPFFHREPDHQPQAGHHNPAGKPKCQVAVRSARICPCVLALDVPWACPKVGDEETFDSAIYAEKNQHRCSITRTARYSRSTSFCQFVKVNLMRNLAGVETGTNQIERST